MNIKIEHVRRDLTSCNFCLKGSLTSDSMSLKYPYHSVITFVRDSGNGACVSMCEACLNELSKHGKELFELDRRDIR